MSKSSPLDSASSIAERTDLPANDGTTIPPCSTSKTTVPFVGGGTKALSIWPDDTGAEGAGVTVSLCRIAAGITTLATEAGAPPAGCTAEPLVGPLSNDNEPSSPSLGLASATSSGSPGWSGDPSSRSLSLSLSLLRASSNCRLGGISTSCAVCRYSSTCCAIRVNTGAETCPPWCSPTGESRITAIVMAGLLIGAKPANDATYLVRE